MGIKKKPNPVRAALIPAKFSLTAGFTSVRVRISLESRGELSYGAPFDLLWPVDDHQCVKRRQFHPAMGPR